MAQPTASGVALLFAGALSIIATTTWTSASYAQVPALPIEAAPSVYPPLEAPSAPAPPDLAVPSPVAAPVMPKIADAEAPRELAASDMDVEARRWAIGYAGISQVPVGLTPNPIDIAVPAIGLRYWTSPKVGVDVALGFGWSGGSTEVAGSSMDKDSTYGFILQAGLPLALATHRHVSFQVIPFATFARGKTSAGTGAVATNLSGTRIDIGARAGFELFFGFIGIPELALSATVGMQFERRRYNTESGGFSQSDTTLNFTTTIQNNPWDIFAGSVAARYYF